MITCEGRIPKAEAHLETGTKSKDDAITFTTIS